MQIDPCDCTCVGMFILQQLWCFCPGFRESEICNLKKAWSLGSSVGGKGMLKASKLASSAGLCSPISLALSSWYS